MDKFDINEVENVLADQRDTKGLIDCFSDKVEGQFTAINDYDEAGQVPHNNVVGLLVQVMHDQNEVLGLLRFIADTSINSINSLENSVAAYYSDRKDGDKSCN